MQPNDKQLWRKLIIVIVLKLIIITAIYWLFMRPSTTKITDTNVEKHLLSQSTLISSNDV